jgi:hypothetical protein
LCQWRWWSNQGIWRRQGVWELGRDEDSEQKSPRRKPIVHSWRRDS